MKSSPTVQTKKFHLTFHKFCCYLPCFVVFHFHTSDFDSDFRLPRPTTYDPSYFAMPFYCFSRFISYLKSDYLALVRLVFLFHLWCRFLITFIYAYRPPVSLLLFSLHPTISSVSLQWNIYAIITCSRFCIALSCFLLQEWKYGCGWVE